MLKKLYICITFALFLLFPGFIFAQSFPQYKGFVNDFAHIIDDEIERTLETKLYDYEKQTTHEIVVVTVANLDGMTVEDYANRLFEKWKIGKKDKDNGILILVALNEKRVRIEVGYGLEGVVPDAKSGRIIDEYMLPEFRLGSYSNGIIKGIDVIMDIIAGEELPLISKNKSEESANWLISLFIFGAVIIQYLAAFLGRSKEIWPGGLLGGIIGLIIGVIFLQGLLVLLSLGIFAVIGLILDFILSKNYKERVKQGLSTSWWGSGGGFFSGRSSGFGGGGFGGFGGGSSGGGGSSRGW